MRAIRAILKPSNIETRDELKQFVSAETGIPFGRVSDHIFFRVAVRFLAESFGRNRERIMELFREEIASHQSTFHRKKRS